MDFNDFVDARKGSGRKASKNKWWKISRSKVTDEEKRRRRFEGDTRPYSEQNAHHRKTANFLSYFFQVVSISGAIYGSFRMFWDYSIIGISLFAFSLIILYHFEKLARWTSDQFWDEYAAGRWNLKFAFLNFGVIWNLGLLVTLGGIYFMANDSQPVPNGSISSTDPAYVRMQEEVAAARADVVKAEKRVSSFKTDKNNLCKENGKWVVCYNRRKALGKLDEAILVAEQRVTSASNQMDSRFGTIKILDDRETAYQLTVNDSRFYAQLGIVFLCLLMFEFCMRYRSKYDMMLYWEEEYARVYGRKPKTKSKMSPESQKGKKPLPQPSKGQVGVKNEALSRESVALSSKNAALMTSGDSLIGLVEVLNEPPPALDEGERFCALDGCLEKVSGRRRFCCNSHRVTNHQRNG